MIQEVRNINLKYNYIRNINIFQIWNRILLKFYLDSYQPANKSERGNLNSGKLIAPIPFYDEDEPYCFFLLRWKVVNKKKKKKELLLEGICRTTYSLLFVPNTFVDFLSLIELMDWHGA